MRSRAGVTGVFADREHGGRHLADRLERRHWVDPIVLGLARGGVPVARIAAERLGAPFDVAVARKIGAPGRPEFGIGAVTASGPAIYDVASLTALKLSPVDLAPAEAAERAEARRRTECYRAGRDDVRLRNRDVILVDDGLATGVTATAAVRALRGEDPLAIVVAAPVCSAAASSALLGDADDVVCAMIPEEFLAVGRWYQDFRQVADEDVVAILG